MDNKRITIAFFKESLKKRDFWKSYILIKRGSEQVKYFLLGFFRFYRKYLSGLKRNYQCIYIPTCSQYGIEALEKYGVIRGLAYTTWRILRCNPFAKGGYDPVP